MGFIKIDNSDIRLSLKDVRRQYLVGNLQLPQKLDFIRSEDLEIGISSYAEYTEEIPHYHDVATEYQFVLSGWTKYFDTETLQEYEFRKGDFYVIEKGTHYAQKCKAGTQILFIKVPSINDKTTIEINDSISNWFEEKLHTTRKDYMHQADMPQANSVKPAAAVAIIKNECILMLHRKDNGKWTLPGGTLEMNERLTACAVREVQEETGLEVQITDILGTYSDPDIRIAYSDGEVRREFTIVYIGEVKGTNVIIDRESSGYQWIKIEDALLLPLADSQRQRLLDVQYYLSSNIRAFR